MKDEIKEYIIEKDMISAGDAVWAAFSGGADSCCLLHILNRLGPEMGFELKAVHVNHMLRGEESGRDERFCIDFCNKIGVGLEVYREDVRKIAAEGRMTVEEAGRKVRYGIFEKRCPGKIALAHNQNDNAETVLMNLLRGSGTDGFSGISPVNGRYIRPLLAKSRREIEMYLEQNGIPNIEDSSNKDTDYFRNAVRLKLLPLMDDITGRDSAPVLARAAEMARMDSSYLSQAAEEAYSEIAVAKDKMVVLDNVLIMKLHPAIAARAARKAVESIKGDLKDIGMKNTETLMDIMRSNRTGDAADLPGGIRALVQFGRTIIYKPLEKEYFEYVLPVPGNIYIKERDITATAAFEKQQSAPDPRANSHYFCFGGQSDPITVRNRRNGDIIKPWKGRGTAKLKKYFIDRKVSRPERDEKIIIACGSSVAYIEGMAYGREFMPVEGCDTVRISFERGRRDA
ncbi:MAG: tRNA lysidine(34) synthetase TilS [Clostridia bacterium]|nr:tRNA lysidine(34) synthetase TilS [Clostridia bacterium]